MRTSRQLSQPSRRLLNAAVAQTYASLSLGAEFVSNKFADYYYSVTPANSLATGGLLPASTRRRNEELEGGPAAQPVDYRVICSHGISIFGYGEYSRLVGDFKRSPIVSLRGSANQWTARWGSPTLGADSTLS